MDICLPPLDSFVVITEDIHFDKIRAGVPTVEFKPWVRDNSASTYGNQQRNTLPFDLLKGDWFKLSTVFYPPQRSTDKHATLSLLFSLGGKRWFKKRIMTLAPGENQKIHGRIFRVGAEFLNGRAEVVLSKEHAMEMSARLKGMEQERASRWELLET
jgi:hypothetical protein